MKLIKNMRLRPRLIIAFAIVAFFSVVVGAMGILNMRSISQGGEGMYTENVSAMEYLAMMYDNLGGQRICLSNFALFYETDNRLALEEKADLSVKEKEFMAAMESFRLVCYSDAEIALYDSMYDGYTGGFAQAKLGVINAVEAPGNDSYGAGVANAIKGMDSWGADVSGLMDEAYAINEDLALARLETNKNLYNSGTTVIIIVTVVAFAVSGALGLLIAISISAPLGRLLTLTRKTAETGDLNLDAQTLAESQADAGYRDEISQVVGAVSAMMNGIIQKAKLLEVIASGDLTVEVPLTSPRDTLGVAEKQMVDSLSAIFEEVGAAAGQVSGGAAQIADGAQMLASASTQQAATVEQLSATIAQVSDKTRQNAAMAERAARLAEEIHGNAQAGSGQMARMTEAVRQINEASKAISQVISVIDGIAFQTNILALNASVEAARAGQHGRGFAVVAEEVRSLASKSAEAAKSTGALIAQSVEKAELGSAIARETAESLGKIVEGVGESAQVVADIARSSDEQSAAVSDINRGIEQLSQVVQQNSATAQQSAASSQEMSSQSSLLRQQIARIKLAGQSSLPALPGAGGYGASGGNRY